MKQQFDMMDKYSSAIAEECLPGGKQAVATVAFSKLLKTLRDPLHLKNLLGEESRKSVTPASPFH